MGLTTLVRKFKPQEHRLLGGRCRILKGTLEEWLPTLAKQTQFDAELADPPYELGFMNRHWDASGVAFNPETWRMVWRCLKPGALALNFGGTRTFHRMMTAVEDAGFYLVDTFCWCYGSGMPKGLDISKAMDNFYEQERPREPNRPNERRVSQSLAPSGYNLPGWQPTSKQPVTEQAKRWEGYNTALKPAWEPVPLFVKPGADSYALQTLVHECGVLNIGATRIGTEQITVKGGGAKHYAGGKSCYSQHEINASHNGRHPANLVLSHHPLCRFLGHKKVKGLPTGMAEKGTVRRGKTVFATSGLQSQYIGRSGFGDDSGEETVPSWQCNVNCPVRMLDAQAGVTASKAARVFMHGTRQEKDNLFRRKQMGDLGPNNTYTDEGGPSRYFLQTLPVRFLYVPKASRSERDAGIKGKPRPVGALQGSRDGTLNPAPEGLNDHECIKPIDLCKYYATLLLPPPRSKNRPRRLLVPFSGSCSEMIGALLAGWDEVVGVEMDADHVRKGIDRVNHWCGK